MSAASSTSLRQNTGWALAGNVGYAACQWAILVALAKLASAADVGHFALALALIAPVMILANLHLRALQATDARQQYPFVAYLVLRLVTTALAVLAVTILALVLGYRGAALAVIVLLAIAKAAEALSDVLFGLQQQAERFRPIALSLLAKGTLSVVAVAVVLWLTHDVVLATLALALAWGAVLVLVDVPAAARLAPLTASVSLPSLARLAWCAAPMGVVMSLNSLTASVPRYAIAADIGPTALGHFAALAYLFLAGTQPLVALGTAASPRLARSFLDDLPAFQRLVRRTLLAAVAFGVAAVVTAAVAGAPLLARVYAPEYAVHGPVLVWLAVGAGVGFLASGLGFAVTAARRFPQQLVIALAALVVGALASAWLVPRHGLTGAAWAVLATETTRLIALTLVYRAACRARPGHAQAGIPVRATPRPALRVLHVFGSLDRGGAETRTLEIMRRVDRARHVFDFCVLGGRPGAYAPEVERLGGRVLACTLRPGRLTFPLRLLAHLRRGRYDVVHSHVHHFSGVILLVARLAGVRTRIAHVRSAHDGHRDHLRRRVYRACMRRLITASATRVVGVSEGAMDAFWGLSWRSDRRAGVIYNGIEAARFRTAPGFESVRDEFDVPADARLLVHVGRFSPAKNQHSLVAIVAALVAARRDARLPARRRRPSREGRAQRDRGARTRHPVSLRRRA